MANFLVVNNDGADRAEGPLGSGKFLSLPFLKLFNKDMASSRDCRLDTFVNSPNPYHVQCKEPRV